MLPDMTHEFSPALHLLHTPAADIHVRRSRSTPYLVEVAEFHPRTLLVPGDVLATDPASGGELHCSGVVQLRHGVHTQVRFPRHTSLIPLRRAEKAVLRSGASCVSRLGTTLCVFWGELLSVTSAKAVVRRALREEPLKISALHSGERTVLLHRHNYARSPDTPVLHAA